jgi:hypothetical protein
MKYPRPTVLAFCAVALASTWAGWYVGSGVDDSAYAAATRRARRFIGPPAPAPAGWNRTVSAARPSFDKDELAARAYENAESAVTEVMAQPAGPERNLRIISLLRGWAARDPLAAAEWLTGLAPSETPELPFKLIEPIFAGAPYEAATKGLLGFLAAKASPALLGLASEGPVFNAGKIDSDRRIANRLHTVTEAFATWSVWRPNEAMEWVRSVRSPEARQWLMAEAVGAMAKNGAADQAIAFFNSEPELHETGGVRLLAEGWARADPSAALAWANQLEDASLRDTYLAAALRAVPAGHAPAALATTAYISDPTERDSLRAYLVDTSLWNQAAIRRWIDADPSLSESERLMWRRKLETR